LFVGSYLPVVDDPNFFQKKNCLQLADNYPEPGKRPLSSCVPTIFEHSNGSFYLAVGGSGGSRIFGAVLQVLLNIGWGMDAGAAVEYGRLHDPLYPPILEAEGTYPKQILDSLRGRGHNVTG
jgi:gamma-glutamyltranspeptidase/glutathione hydrolase/leukotriene-C4 hydrolase